MSGCFLGPRQMSKSLLAQEIGVEGTKRLECWLTLVNSATVEKMSFDNQMDESRVCVTATKQNLWFLLWKDT